MIEELAFLAGLGGLGGRRIGRERGGGCMSI